MLIVVRSFGVAVAAVLLALPAASAGAAAPAFTGFAASTGSVPLSGGWVTVTGSATSATACGLADASGRPLAPYRPYSERAPTLRTVSSACRGFRYDVHVPASTRRRTLRFTAVAFAGPVRRSRPLRVVEDDVARPADPNAVAQTTFVAGDGSSAPHVSCSTATDLDTNPLTTPKQPIEPLGHINDDHVLPNQADHVYLWLPGANLGRNGVSRVPPTQVVSPGRVTLLEIVRHVGDDGTHYELDFSPCRSLMFWFDHVTRLASGIRPGSSPDHCTPDRSTCAWTHLSEPLRAGEPVGWTGGVEHLLQLDFGAADVRTPPLAFIDQNRSVLTGATADSFSHAVCPLRYFTPSAERLLFAQLQGPRSPSNGIPPCGATMQDRSGTLQGNWYRLDSPNTSPGGHFDFATALAVVHYNIDPARGVVGMGKRLLPGSSRGDFFTFAPRASGVDDLEPSRARPGRTTFCYDGVRNRTSTEVHVLMRLVDPATLYVQYGLGGCAGAPPLSNPTIYVR